MVKVLFGIKIILTAMAADGFLFVLLGLLLGLGLIAWLIWRFI